MKAGTAIAIILVVLLLVFVFTSFGREWLSSILGMFGVII